MPAQRLYTTMTLLALLGWSCVAAGYPLYGSEERGILRLQQARLAHEGIIPGRQKVAGELLHLDAVDLRLQQEQQLQIPPPDPRFAAEIRSLLDSYGDAISLSVLDLSDPDNPL